MYTLKAILRTHKVYFLILLFIGLVGLCFDNLFYIPLGSDHPYWLTVFFVNYSFMGDGLFALALAAWFFYKKKKQTAITLLFSFLFCEMIIQIIKNMMSNSANELFFEKVQYLFFTDETELSNFHSFPSGYTAMAFSIVTVLVLMRETKWQLTGLMAAVLLGISRMYLAQNSIADLVAGCFVGSFSGLMIYWGVKNAAFFIGKLRKPRFFNPIREHTKPILNP